MLNVYKSFMIGFLYAYVCTLCTGAAAFQIYFHGDHIPLSIASAVVAGWLTYKRFKKGGG